MEVEVRVFGGLDKYLPGGKLGKPVIIELPQTLTGKELIRRLEIPEAQVFTMLVNGKHAKMSQWLKDGDRVAFFPPVAGG